LAAAIITTVDDFAFNWTPINESLVRDLAGDNFAAQAGAVPP
jgi:hypothetical protein